MLQVHKVHTTHKISCICANKLWRVQTADNPLLTASLRLIQLHSVARERLFTKLIKLFIAGTKIFQQSHQNHDTIPKLGNKNTMKCIFQPLIRISWIYVSAPDNQKSQFLSSASHAVTTDNINIYWHPASISHLSHIWHWWPSGTKDIWPTKTVHSTNSWGFSFGTGGEGRTQEKPAGPSSHVK